MKFFSKQTMYTIIVSILSIVAVILYFIDPISKKDLMILYLGAVLNIFVVYFLFQFVETYFEKNNLINRYKEEIDDYRFLEFDDVKYRTFGNIKRLQKLGVFDFNLFSCFLANLHLENFEFSNSDFNHANFTGSVIRNCIFKNINFSGACFAKSNIFNCKFVGCKINGANFFDAILYEVDLENSDLCNFDLSNNLIKARTIYNPKNMNDSLYSKIKEERPDLLEKPSHTILNRWFDDKIMKNGNISPN